MSAWEWGGGGDRLLPPRTRQRDRQDGNSSAQIPGISEHMAQEFPQDLLAAESRDVIRFPIRHSGLPLRNLRVEFQQLRPFPSRMSVCLPPLSVLLWTDISQMHLPLKPCPAAPQELSGCPSAGQGRSLFSEVSGHPQFAPKWRFTFWSKESEVGVGKRQRGWEIYPPLPSQFH